MDLKKMEEFFELRDEYKGMLNFCVALEELFNIGDVGGGYKLREVFPIELAHFMICIGAKNDSFREIQAMLLNIVTEQEYFAYEYENVGKDRPEPDARNSITIDIFATLDAGIDKQQKKCQMEFCGLLIRFYQKMGDFMACNDAAKAARDKYIEEMRNFITSKYNEKPQ